MLSIYKPHYKNLGQNIAFYRKRRGFTQEKLSEMVGINNVHLSRIETGDAAASLDVLFSIADVLDVEPGKLFENKE